MVDIFGREVNVGDKILRQSKYSGKGLAEAFVAEITTNFGQDTLITVDTLEQLSRHVKGSGGNATRSQFVVLQSKLGKLSWMKY
ncbi:MAG: hypothetical protein GY827_04780 [Cytophagales bacterium]|nr:hypothetical protein [Cytophagales bacterium]